MTLGSFSLFRGIAEGLTHGAVNYTDFPASFLALGQGYLWRRDAGATAVFHRAFVAVYAVLLHRSVHRTRALRDRLRAGGRALRRHPGRAARRRSCTCLSGVVASVAAIIYVAHLGQARSDAGTGYELAAITAVVLGGTSVFGGRGTVWGTLLGLFALACCKTDCGWRRCRPNWRAS